MVAGIGMQLRMRANSHDAVHRPASEILCGKPVFWLHIPKCGSSFFNTVSHCQQVNGSSTLDATDNPHPPLPDNADKTAVVSFFRRPDQRLASGYAYARKHKFALHLWGHQGAGDNSGLTFKKAVQEGKSAVDDEVLDKDFHGCQTNMVLGRGCMAGTPENPIKDAEEAIKIVKQFFFVGLTEEWLTSICLFNYLVSGEKFVTGAQLKDTRPSSGKAASDYNTKGTTVDAADEKLYEYVKKRFEADAKKHGITRESCPVRD